MHVCRARLGRRTGGVPGTADDLDGGAHRSLSSGVVCAGHPGGSGDGDGVKPELGLENLSFRVDSGLVGTCYVYALRDWGVAQLLLYGDQRGKRFFEDERQVVLKTGMNEIRFDFPSLRLPTGHAEMGMALTLVDGRVLKSSEQPFLVVDAEGFSLRMALVKMRSERLRTLISEIEAKGLCSAYQRLAMRVADWFIPMAEGAHAATAYERAERTLAALEEHTERDV